ncbi:hypothetical protein POMI540_4401 [Schizosaccharomyces pombe]|uniref:Uncharacterized protein C23D3.16 n=1 Tax=Schizosaccharomyces pombe (strain 972 / ATCC 24843) TaxID=284812 RepID=YAEP_SCHPO|nr:uncharacterized protein SPAC23D3.16 [Schizosaccharomyces pombe]C6Y4A8.2 RecName: Full=Uncharacterized protein C23D3.16 [Schizosaccharomyces pombe 972h-]8FW5_I Chain I, Schizosaccharomyces pombe LAM4, Human LAMTOR5 ortholog [Escherichia coli]CBA11505.2 sequence orphan [Schizosaccharomyces pombe]|eukprot:NP_001343080.1 uncharacterized protein SPAC23D3.16 [Schizosaccharomyces pombe]
MDSQLSENLLKCVNETYRGAMLVRNGLPIATAGDVNAEEQRVICEWNSNAVSEVLHLHDSNTKILIATKESCVLGLIYRNT